MVKLVDQAIKNGGRQGLPGKKTLCFSAMQVTILMKICKWQVAASHFKMKWRKRSMLLQLHLSNEKRAPGCGCLGYGNYTSQLCGDYNETIIRIPTQQPSVIYGKSAVFFVAHLEFSHQTEGLYFLYVVSDLPFFRAWKYDGVMIK